LWIITASVKVFQGVSGIIFHWTANVQVM
jgi:hypothetical protein